ncbi:glycosyltransferase family 2 protein [Xanthobacter sp. AM11]|uniref:glycosyltransferase family 2 protein n=1 Tax=Xanthobacter sp. AM11 TaxID=3380643 RepID=UPI0039BEE96D
MSTPTALTIVILTRNEEMHIARCMAAVASLGARIVIVDSGSTDRTVAIAQELGADVLHNRFVNYATQFQWALDNAAITSDWIMRLDADEVIEPDLVAQIQTELPKLASDVAGVNLNRKHIFLGRWVRHGGRFPLVLLRIWRRGQGRIENRWMDEHMIVWGGRTVSFDGGFADFNLNDLTFFTDKHNKYATREAIDVLNQKYGFFARDESLSTESASFQASAKRFVKERVYNKAPFWVGPFGYFLFRYFIQLGFLDGSEGLIYHFLQGFWYRFLVGAKVLELEREIAGLASMDAKLARLRQVTGLAL